MQQFCVSLVLEILLPSLNEGKNFKFPWGRPQTPQRFCQTKWETVYDIGTQTRFGKKIILLTVVLLFDIIL